MEPATSSLSLIERVRRGDRDAFAPLFEKYRNRLAALLHYKMSARLRESVEVDDLIQETLIRAFGELDNFLYQAPGSFFHWLARIAEHVVIDAARFEGRKKRCAGAKVRFRSPSNPDGPEPVDSRTPSRLYAERERLDRMLQTLDSLPENYRQVVIMAKVEGLTTSEMAEKLGKSREAISLLLHRAIKQIRSTRRWEPPK